VKPRTGITWFPEAHVPAVATPALPQPLALKPTAGGLEKPQRCVSMQLIVITLFDVRAAGGGGVSPETVSGEASR
jgi:hypothetical protein